MPVKARRRRLMVSSLIVRRCPVVTGTILGTGRQLVKAGVPCFGTLKAGLPGSGRQSRADHSVLQNKLGGDRMGSDRLRIGSGSAWWGDRVEPAALNAEHGRPRLSLLRDHGRGHRLGGAGARAARSRLPRLRHLSRRPHARGAAGLHARSGTRIVSNQGWINPDGAAQRIVALAARARATRASRSRPSPAA